MVNFLSTLCQNRVNIVSTLCWHCVNILSISYQHCGDIFFNTVSALCQHCVNIVSTFCQTLSTSIVSIFYILLIWGPSPFKGIQNRQLFGIISFVNFISIVKVHKEDLRLVDEPVRHIFHLSLLVQICN